ncbi:N-acetylmuramoyl-L-alanine amidase [Sporolituus thermophilus DSM 23256]|uniref:N-acetylmuramoyl-L-alanine amidase n=1 Tax=Sporolituus thermophilus DSM 23256 TaxID=1123285 RepID=A0A1G7N7Z0_9FIRM|nr:N-acetylmuramoyl-L-alanine amidase [Sporolituus thermophilus DSM 23256]
MRRTILAVSLCLLLLTPPAFAGPNGVTVTPEPKPAAQIPVVRPEPAAVKQELPLKQEITNIRWATHEDALTGQSKLRLVLDVSGPVRVEAETAAAPTPRLVVNIKGAVPGKVKDALSFGGKIADGAELVATGLDSSRLIVDVPLMLEDGDYRVFTLPSDPKFNRPFRVVVDVNKKVPPVTYKFRPGLKNKVIAIDPGHGGSDPGAIGLGKSQEKVITLAVAKQVQALLEKAGAKVIMTRQDDRDVFGPNATAVEELKARTSIANNRKADVFISIHINSFTNSAAGGTSTYYYQKTPYDMLLAQNLQSALLQAGGLYDRGANPANFYVIKRTVMPATLVELAFISNPEEEKLLNTPQFQQKMAQGIVQGLDRFFAQAAKLGGER